MMKKSKNLKSKSNNSEFNLSSTAKVNFRLYLKLYSMLSKNFFKSFAGPFYSFGLPLFFLFLFFFTLGKQDGVNGHSVIGGYILLASVTTGFNFLTNRITEWKESVFLKRLDVTPLKKWQFLFAIITFYSFICLLGTIWMLLWSIIVNPLHQFDNWKDYSNFGYIILGIITNIFVAISMAIFIGGAAKSSSASEGIGTLIFFPSIFLSGIILPLSALGSGSVKEVINIIGYFIPIKYSVSVFLYGWWHHFPITANTAIAARFSFSNLGFTQLWQPLLGAYGISALLLLVSLKTFKWEV